MVRACGVLYGPGNSPSYGMRADETGFGYAISRQWCDRADPMAFLREASRRFPNTSCLLYDGHGVGNRNSVMPDVNRGRMMRIGRVGRSKPQWHPNRRSAS
jgi:hypothetical protein